MEDEKVLDLTTTGVGARFVSQTEIDQAREVREQQWRAAYARCVVHSYSQMSPSLLTAD